MTNAVQPHDSGILVIDDEPDLRTLYELTLLREGYRVETAGSVADAQALLEQRRFSVVITDMRLPDGLGIELLVYLKLAQRPERCVVITAHGSAENAVESLKAGAFDYLTKPVDLKQFRSVIASAVQDTLAAGSAVRTSPAAQPSRGLERSNAGVIALEHLVGESDVMRSVKERILKVSRSMAPVLVRGESGTGKELVARALHANSHRFAGPLVAVNCSAIPDNLLEAEFFGARKGAYTGSTHDRDGFFQAAKGGTLFLDEIGDLPLAMQSKLLRAIQERCVRAIGSNVEEQVDVRIISATHKDLAEEIVAGRFRQDLFYRLNVIDIFIPPLRERLEDLPVLCNALLRKIAAEAHCTAPSMSAQAISQLSMLPLLGNVRELENLLHRAVALGEGTELNLDEALHIASPSAVQVQTQNPVSTATLAETRLPGDLQNHLDAEERDILIRALRATGFNRTLAANLLGLSLRQIRYRIARLKIDAPSTRDDPDMT
jgi:two-component system response regulator PilR (NtrC family)